MGGGSGSPLLGTWRFRTGSSLGTCDDGTSPTEELAGNAITIQASGDNDVTVSQGGCGLRFSVTSGLGSLTGTQDCSVSGTLQGGVSFTGTLRFTAGSLQYVADTDLRLSQTYRAQLRYSTGQTLSCDVNTNGSLSKF